MLLDILTKPLAYLYFQKVKLFEKKIGYRLILHNLKPNWIDSVMIFDMTPVWKKHKIDAGGINYYTIGAIEDGVSTRFQYQSPYYQAWLGGYIVQFTESRNWTVQDHFALGEADQKNWLAMYGDPRPLAVIPEKDCRKLKKIRIGKYQGNLYEVSGWSHTDIGQNKKSVTLAPLLSVCANVFNISNPNLKLTGQNLLPIWSDDVPLSSYQKVNLKGYVAIISINKTTKAVLYNNATVFKDISGKEYNYFSKIKNNLEKQFKSFNIVAA